MYQRAFARADTHTHTRVHTHTRACVRTKTSLFNDPYQFLLDRKKINKYLKSKFKLFIFIFNIIHPHVQQSKM